MENVTQPEAKTLPKLSLLAKLKALPRKRKIFDCALISVFIALLAATIYLLIIYPKTLAKTTTPPISSTPVINTNTTKPTDTTTPAKDDTSTTPTQGDDSDAEIIHTVVTTKGNFKINYKTTPLRIKSLDIFTNQIVDGETSTYDFDDHTSYYNVGTFADGAYKGYDAIFGFNSNEDSPLPEANLGEVIAKNSTKTLLFNYGQYTPNSSEISTDPALKYTNNSDPTIINKAIVLDYNKEMYQNFYNTPDFALTESDVVSPEIINEYDPKNVTEYIKVDGVQIFTLKSDKNTFVTRTPSGFYKVNYIDLMGKNTNKDGILQITWSTPTAGANASNYSSQVLGVCLGGEDIVTVDPTDLSVVGKTKLGSNVYQYTDVSKDTYVKAMYDEDYAKADSEMNKSNGITEDDTTKLTYDQYLLYHPVFYWKDEFGRYVRFKSGEFAEPLGCGAKPAVYLYPTQTTDIRVSVVPNGRLTLLLPKFNLADGWFATAQPDGQLTVNGNKFDYLWWESKKFGAINYNPNDGFILHKANLQNELTGLLSQMNLNQKEITQFIEYWLPKMKSEKSEDLYVSFLFNDQVNQLAKLEITPKPTNEFRVFMLYAPATQGQKVTAQKIKKANRTGYTVIEWGGGKL